LKDANSVGIWFAGPNLDATINERGTVTQVSQPGGSPGDWSTNVARDHTIKENESVGFNLAFQATDNLSLTLDAHSSTSKFGGAGIGGEPASSENLIIGNTSCSWCQYVPGAGPSTATIGTKTGTFASSGVPTMTATFVDGNGNPIGFPGQQDIGSLFGQAFNTKQKNAIDQIQLGGSWKNADKGAIKSIDFGYGYTKQSFDDQNAYSNNLPAGYWNTSAQYWQNGVLQKGSFAGLLSNFTGAAGSLNQFYTIPFDAAVEGISDSQERLRIRFMVAAIGPHGGRRSRTHREPPGASGRGHSVRIRASRRRSTRSIRRSSIHDDFNGMPFNAIFGLRYEQLDEFLWTGNSGEPASSG
jgi:hypothetical protein